MNLFNRINNFGRPPGRLTRSRMGFALAVALVSDAVQVPLQAVPGAPEVIDVIAMVLTTAAIGFHVLLLPTFVLEFIPLVDMMPTWTGCVIAVLALRRRKPDAPPSPPDSIPPKLEETTDTPRQLKS